VGPGGHIECLHYDPLNGTLMQLHWAKKVLLFPSSQTDKLYPFPVYIHLLYGLKLRAWFSMVYPENPDFVSFPKLKQALQHKQEVRLNQGEMLYIPAHWWYEVTALGDEMVCSVNHFWRVYPTLRVVFSWSSRRVILADICAVPYLLLQKRDRSIQLG
jgi:lysine-specific demethylase 8/hypoxia-inducible factor 1-alpha inhibitor (HIF hydroxylase)